MHKILTLLLFLACTHLSFSQIITLKGKITGPDDFPLESATVYITSAKDSTVVDYTITDKNGNWELRTRKIEKPVFLKISYVGFADYKQPFEGLTENREFDTIKLADQSTDLSEVVIEGEIPPIRIKSDTLEFNASSFKVRPDSNVQTLLKQLPGVDIDEEGKITVNGKEVNQILVNGKPFFDQDGKIALQNLPADIINKVQVTDAKTKEEELTGQKASGDTASINLTIDEEKNKGLFGKIMGGYGTDDRYESSALVNYFKGPRKISLLASSNNINSTGFSMNEIFDSMGGGRNMSIYTNDNGSFGINGMQFGGGSGITRSNMIGLNYADEWVKGFDGTGSYFYTSADTENRNRTSLTNFLPERIDPVTGAVTDESYITESTSNSVNTKYAHNLNTEFNIKIDSTSGIWFAPKFVKASSDVKNTSTRFSQRLDNNRLLNDSDAFTSDINENNALTTNLNYYKSFNKRGRMISLNMYTENRKDDGSQLNQSVTNSYSYDADGTQNTTADVRDQIRYNRQTTDNYNFNFEFLEPLMDSLKLKVGVNYNLNKRMEDRDGFDFNEATNSYTDYNDALSNLITSNTSTIRPIAGVTMDVDKIWLNVEAGTQITKFDNFSNYLGQDYTLNKDYALPYAEATLSYRMTKSKSMWVRYGYDIEFPDARQVLPVLDISNPLYTYIGNPDLDPSKRHNFNLSYRNFDFATRSGYSIYAGGGYNDLDIVQSTVVDSSAISNTTYFNVKGTYSAYFGANWSKSIKNEAHTYRINLGASGNLGANKGFLNGSIFESTRVTISPKVNFTYEYGELLTINPTYNFSYNQFNYSNYIIDKASNFVHRINLQTTSYWPKHVVFGNDFGYTYNSQIADGFKKDFYLWNSSIGYNFLKDRLLFKVKVYDVLNQNLGTSRTIGATSIRDEENIVLQRYFMFSLTYKLDKFGGKKDGGSSPFWFF